jgi:hypothetical protein
VTPRYYSLDCIRAADGRLVVIDIQGGVGSGLELLLGAYGGRSSERDRLESYLRRLAEAACGRRILFLQDPFESGQPVPEDFFSLVQKYAAFGPIIDWVGELQEHRRSRHTPERRARADRLTAEIESAARRLRVPLAWCGAARLEQQEGSTLLLVSGYRERFRQQGVSRVVSPDEIGLVAFQGPTQRFPEALGGQSEFPVVNPPLLDRVFDNRWLPTALLESTPASRFLPRWIPVGMGLRTAGEVREFTDSLSAPAGFPLAVLKPSHPGRSLALRFLDRIGRRALEARHPARRLPSRALRELLNPRLIHTYDEITAYRGKQLDNLLRLPGAEVLDHGDGTFRFAAPYPFLESTVALLQEYVEEQPVRSRRTGRLHRGYLRAQVLGGELLAAIHVLDEEPDDGTFRDLTRPGVRTLREGASQEEVEELRPVLQSFIRELEHQIDGRIRTAADLQRLRDRWITEQVGRA